MPTRQLRTGVRAAARDHRSSARSSVLGAIVDSTSVIARAEHRAVTGQHPFGVGVEVDGRRHESGQTRFELVEEPVGGIGDHRTRREDRAAPASRSASKSWGGITPADHDEDVVTAEVGQFLAQLRHEGEVPGCQRRCPHDVHVGLDRLAGDLRGVENSGPTSTSKPRSAKAVAITFCPRSWPSCPILATRMRGRRPWRGSKAAARSRTALGCSPLPRPPAVHPLDGADRRPCAARRPSPARR